MAAGHRLGCPRACGIVTDQGENPGPLRGQVDSSPLDCQGSPVRLFLFPDRRGVWGGRAQEEMPPGAVHVRKRTDGSVCVRARAPRAQVHAAARWGCGGGREKDMEMRPE